MIKIRVEGKREDIYKYLDLLQKDSQLTVYDISNCYRNHGVSLYDRCFVEFELNKSQLNQEEEKYENSF